MSSTPNLLISHIAASQNSKEVTANASADALDEAMNSFTSIAMADADYTFSAVQGSIAFSSMVFIMTGALTADRNVILPALPKLSIFVNATTGGHKLTLKVGTAAHVVVLADSSHHLVHNDGVNSVYEMSPSASGMPVRTDAITGYLQGAPTSSEVVFQIPVAFAYSFPLNLVGSEGNVVTPTTATAVFSIRKNGTEFATLTFSVHSPIDGRGVFASSNSPLAAVSFSVGDILEIVAPASPDATLAGLGFQLVATRAY